MDPAYLDQMVVVEKMCLAYCVSNGETPFNIMSGYLRYDEMYVPAHMDIYAALAKLSQGNHPIDILTVYHQCKAMGSFVDPSFISDLISDNKVYNIGNFESHCRILKEFSARRFAYKALIDLFPRLTDATQDIFETLDAFTQRLDNINKSFDRNRLTTFGEALMDTVKGMEFARDNPDQMLGLPTGIVSLDKKTGGMLAPDLTILAAGPGEGKSTMLLQWILYIIRRGGKVAIFSLEMKARQMIWKMFSYLIEEDVLSIRSGQIPEHKWKRLMEEINKIYDCELYIIDIAGLSINDLIAAVKNLKITKGIGLYAVDYLQLLSTDNCGKHFSNRQEEVGYISRQLKKLCNDLDIPGIALSQFGRLGKGIKRMYELGDLRESGSIEQDADNVAAIWRPFKHGITELSGMNMVFQENDAFLIILKWRLAEADNALIPIKFNGAHSKFYEHNHLSALEAKSFTGLIDPSQSRSNDDQFKDDDDFINIPF